MLTPNQLTQIRNHLEQSQNPIFFFDNDVDGLCSFLILQRALGRGKGVAIKTFPELDKNYIRKINELNPDYVFILDKPRVSKEFIQEVKEKNLPIIWLDHHGVQFDKKILKDIEYFNTFPSSEPVTYIAQKIFNRQQDIWLAMIGCIGDVYMPDFAQEFVEQNPELFDTELSAFDAMYSTKIGKIIKILNFGLKDTTTNVLNMIRFLIKAKNAHDIFEENSYTRQLHKRYNQINQKYEKLLERAEQQITDSKLIFFTYSGQLSISSEISNELYFKHKDKIIVVAYKSQDKANISLRGKNMKQLTEKAIKGIEGASGGGHEESTGVKIPIDKLSEFRKKIQDLVA